MGFLDVGTPLSWADSAAVRDYVKLHGIEQLLFLWRKNRDRKDGGLRWGEEVEYSLVDIDSNTNHSRVYADAVEILEELSLREHIRPKRFAVHLSSEWHPEFSNHMVEAIPSPPYPLTVRSLLMLEPSMRLRRAKVQSLLPQDKYVTSQTAFPRLGLGDFVAPPPPRPLDPDLSVTHSVFIPDELINPHPRFPTLVANIRTRRGANPVIQIPVFQDTYTGQGRRHHDAEQERVAGEWDWSLAQDPESIDRIQVEALARKTINPLKEQIYMDCFAFGMGMSCVQTTFACPDISTARYLYDQLAVLGPLFLAMTASTPFQRGLLSDYDVRWPTLEQAVDCRTATEMLTIPKSRYSGVSRYISDREPLASRTAEYNDAYTPINEDAFRLCCEAGMDATLALHFAYLWVRDPMVIFAEKVQLDDKRAVDHFENIQSTNWNSVRFKPPPPSSEPDKLSPIGWRVEFRTPEVQLTDFDNAAGVALIAVIAQAILALNLDLYIPMSLNDVNMQRSWGRDAIVNKKFFFRREISPNATDRSVVEMSILEILIGSPTTGFKGLIPICDEFLEQSRTTAGGGGPAGCRIGYESQQRFAQYASLFVERASGRLLTYAQYLRRFVQTHPDYAQDSVITPRIAHDLTVLSTNLGFGTWVAPDLHGAVASKLILQTPLPASTALPNLSPQGATIVRFVDEEREEEEEPVETKTKTKSPFVLVRKPVIALNAFDSIYTMPIGVTTRFAANQTANHSTGSCGDPLFDMSLEELLRKNCRPVVADVTLKRSAASLPTMASPSGSQASSPTSRSTDVGAVSSEDFTQAWILKGFDCVGGEQVRCHSGPAKRHLLLCQLAHASNICGSPEYCTRCTAGGQSAVADSMIAERMSTVCPSSTDGGGTCECEIDNEAIHDLSRSLNLGFHTEQELEYFHQVCHASA